MAQTVRLQLRRCHDDLNALKHCMKMRKWNKINGRSQSLNAAMGLLRLECEHHPYFDDDMRNKIKYLDIQLRRVQRQLSQHMLAIAADVEILERGISQADAAKVLLQEQ